ncbi:MAG: hypothetical protein WKF43_00740 [Acidimicrobiales bacterium]
MPFGHERRHRGFVGLCVEVSGEDREAALVTLLGEELRGLPASTEVEGVLRFARWWAEGRVAGSVVSAAGEVGRDEVHGTGVGLDANPERGPQRSDEVSALETEHLVRCEHDLPIGGLLVVPYDLVVAVAHVGKHTLELRDDSLVALLEPDELRAFSDLELAGEQVDAGPHVAEVGVRSTRGAVENVLRDHAHGFLRALGTATGTRGRVVLGG